MTVKTIEGILQVCYSDDNYPLELKLDVQRPDGIWNKDYQLLSDLFYDFLNGRVKITVESV